MSVGNIASQRFVRQVTRMREEVDRLQQQLGTGLKANTYGGLGASRTTALSMRQRLSQIEAYDGTISTVGVRIKLMDTTLTRLDAIPREIKGSLDPNAFAPRADGYTDIQRAARLSLDEAIQLLNSEIGGRYLYAGTKTDVEPVVDIDTLLNGTASKAGLKAVIAERRAADLGLNDGWVTVATLADTTSVGWNTAAGIDRGYRLTDVTVGASAVVVTTDDGLPEESAAITFTAVPPVGEAVTLDFVDPEGNAATITLTAATLPLGPNQFEIGADQAATAANFDRALRLAISALADADPTGSVDGLVSGRLAVDIAGPVVSLGKDDPLNDIFGFSIAGVLASPSVAVTVTDDGTPQEAADLDFTGPLSDGDSVQITLKNPQGADSVITLKGVSAAPLDDGEFLIDADPAVTAANFHTLLREKISYKATTELRAASAVVASEDFFDTVGGFPRRIDLTSGGGEAAFATAYRAPGTDTSVDTVEWYRGQNDPIDPSDLSTQPRQGITARLDRGLNVGYGARANEEGLRGVVQNLALFVADTIKTEDINNPDKLARDQYYAFAERVRIGLSFTGSDGPANVHSEIAIAGRAVETMRLRHITTKAAIEDVLVETEGVERERLAAELLTLTTNLEASYTAAARLSQLSLVYFLR